MRSVMAAFLGAALLAACGPSAPSGGGGTQASSDICATVADTRAVFGVEMVAEADPGIGTIAGGCRWQSSDGAVTGEAALFTPQSIASDPEAATPPLMYAKLSGALDALSDAPVEPVTGLGDEAMRTAQTYGDQTQIVVRKGDQVLIVRASAGSDETKTTALAERLAHALVDTK